MQGEAERGGNTGTGSQQPRRLLQRSAPSGTFSGKFEDDASYRRRYREKLAQWNDYAPLAIDTRLWTEPAA